MFILHGFAIIFLFSEIARKTGFSPKWDECGWTLALKFLPRFDMFAIAVNFFAKLCNKKPDTIPMIKMAMMENKKSPYLCQGIWWVLQFKIYRSLILAKSMVLKEVKHKKIFTGPIDLKRLQNRKDQSPAFFWFNV